MGEDGDGAGRAERRQRSTSASAKTGRPWSGWRSWRRSSCTPRSRWAEEPTRPTVLAFDLDPGAAGRHRRLLPGRRCACASCSATSASSASPRPRARRGCRSTSRSTRRGHLRRDQTVRQSDRPAARKADPRPGRLEDEKGRTQGQGLRRLVPEPPHAKRRSPSTRCAPASARPSRPRSPGRRSSGASRADDARAAWSSRPATCWSGSRSTATSSPRCWSWSRSCRSSRRAG